MSGIIILEVVTSPVSSTWPSEVSSSVDWRDTGLPHVTMVTGSHASSNTKLKHFETCHSSRIFCAVWTLAPSSAQGVRNFSHDALGHFPWCFGPQCSQNHQDVDLTLGNIRVSSTRFSPISNRNFVKFIQSSLEKWLLLTISDCSKSCDQHHRAN